MSQPEQSKHPGPMHWKRCVRQAYAGEHRKDGSSGCTLKQQCWIGVLAWSPRMRNVTFVRETNRHRGHILITPQKEQVSLGQKHERSFRNVNGATVTTT